MKASKVIRRGQEKLKSQWSEESSLILKSHIATLELLESIESLLQKKSYHEHQWQFVPSSWKEETALFMCDCGETKRVKAVDGFNALEKNQE